MKKTDREKVFNKCGGRCAYCGDELKKGWHVDHMEPVERIRATEMIGGYLIYKDSKARVEANKLEELWESDKIEWLPQTIKNVDYGFRNPENHTIENMLPACAS